MGALYTLINLIINENPRFYYAAVCTGPCPRYKAAVCTTSVSCLAHGYANVFSHSSKCLRSKYTSNILQRLDIQFYKIHIVVGVVH